MKYSENPQRDNLIIEKRNEGRSFKEIAKEVNLSPSRVSQIVNTAHLKNNLELCEDAMLRLEKSKLYKKEMRDKNIAFYGTWADKVCLLLPHLDALKAIAEEKNSAR
jgi:predicted DNA-binding protein YlxM (UPF0122 family)